MGAATSEAVAVAQAVASEGGWLAFVVLLAWLVARSRLGRDVARLICTELWYRYLRCRGWSDEELHEWLRERERASPESTS